MECVIPRALPWAAILCPVGARKNLGTPIHCSITTAWHWSGRRGFKSCSSCLLFLHAPQNRVRQGGWLVALRLRVPELSILPLTSLRKNIENMRKHIGVVSAMNHYCNNQPQATRSPHHEKDRLCLGRCLPLCHDLGLYAAAKNDRLVHHTARSKKGQELTAIRVSPNTVHLALFWG